MRFLHSRARGSVGLGVRLRCPGALLTIMMYLLVPSPWVQGQESGEPAAGHDGVVERLQLAIRHEMAAKDLSAFTIALVEGDRLVWADGFGFQDAERTEPATADTVMRVGSVSKLFTDIAVMQLVEQQRIDLDAPVREYLPGFAPRNESGVAITLRQLMSHRAGLVREPPVGNYFDPTEPGLQETVSSLNRTSLVYAPETRTKYSNAGVALVGAVLEERLGVPFAERIAETILKPLGMENSGFVLTPDLRAALATGWMWTYDGRRFEAPQFALGTAPAGNLYSSVRDLSKFLICLFNEGRTGTGALLQPETLQAMMSPPRDSDGKPQAFGIGFHVQELDGRPKVGHGGAVYGFSTQLEALPDRKLGVAAVAALDGSNGVVSRIADFALRLMLARQDAKPMPTYPMTAPVPSPPPDSVRELVGTYRTGERFAKVTELNGRFFTRHGVFRSELRASQDGTLLTDDPIGFGVTVQRGDDGKLIVGKTEYTREPDSSPGDAPERWRGLIGEYGWDHNTLYVLEDHGRLTALIEWFYYYPLEELSENEFAFPDHGMYHGERLQFVRDKSGVATEVVAAEVRFRRRAVGTRDGETFRITPLRPIEDLRAAALADRPPEEQGDYRAPDLVAITALEPSIRLDIRYASTNNFMGTVFYKEPRAFLQRPAAEALARAHRRLRQHGLGLLIHDAYRPWHVTKMFWDATPEELRDFVANPAHGSRHNRGCAVDLTLCDLASGRPVQMVAGYDEFSPRSFADYPGGTARQRWYRELLRRTMEAEGFSVYDFEWWHFDYKDWQQYRIGNVTFDEIQRKNGAKRN